MMDMTEIEKRLQVAGAYRKILDTKLLESGDVNEIIESEVKEFVHGRLEVLLGVRPAENPSVHFSAMEIMALKMLAKKLTDPKKEEEPVVAKPAPKTAAKKAVKKVEKPAPVKMSAYQPVEEEVSPELLAEPVKEPEEMGENIFFEGNRKYEMIDIGGKPFAKDVTKQVTGKGGVAMPPIGQLGNIMQQLAHQELAAVGSDPITAALIRASMG
jgi:hypothetical protein